MELSSGHMLHVGSAYGHCERRTEAPYTEGAEVRKEACGGMWQATAGVAQAPGACLCQSRADLILGDCLRERAGS